MILEDALAAVKTQILNVTSHRARIAPRFPAFVRKHARVRARGFSEGHFITSRNMAARVLARKLTGSAGLAAAALTAGAGVAICESDKRGPLFDPEALERGAKALKEINASPYAKKVRLHFASRLCGYCCNPYGFQNSLSEVQACSASFWSCAIAPLTRHSLACELDAECLSAQLCGWSEYSSLILYLQVFDLTTQQEVTKQQELKTKEAEQSALQQQHMKVNALSNVSTDRNV